MRRQLDVIRLRQLAEIVRARSFSGAAEKLGVSQPALSKSMRALEKELGVQLLERGRFGATPTRFGLALTRHADAIDAELRSATGEIEAIRSARHGSVVIGCGPSEATRLLPLALGRLEKKAPGLKTTVFYGLNEALVPMVRHGEVDLALASIPARSSDPDLRQITLYTDRAAIYARRGHPLHGSRTVTPRQLLDQPWILARQQELERRALDELFLDADLTPPTASIETTSAVLMKSVVMQSDYLTFVPRELVYWEERTGLVKELPLAVPPWKRLVGVTMRARGSLNPAAELLIRCLRLAAKEF
jgi:DNA-binding transcriptional LysR family regulator